MYSNIDPHFAQQLVKDFLRTVDDIGSKCTQVCITIIQLSCLKASFSAVPQAQLEGYFRAIDTTQTGRVRQDHLAAFLKAEGQSRIKESIHRFYVRRVHKQPYLLFTDFIVLFKSLEQSQKEFICSPKSYSLSGKKSISYLSSIIGKEVDLVAQEAKRFSQAIDANLTIGAQLWRLLNLDSFNDFSYPKALNLARAYGLSISPSNWKYFLEWRFGPTFELINQNMFMQLFGQTQFKRRANSAFKKEKAFVNAIQTKLDFRLANSYKQHCQSIAQKELSQTARIIQQLGQKRNGIKQNERKIKKDQKVKNAQTVKNATKLMYYH